MGRPKTIPDSELLELIKKYFEDECKGDVTKLKASEITRYINAHGYPDYRATTLRRTPAAVKFIEQLKTNAQNVNYTMIASYQTLDAPQFVNSHPSRDALIRGLVERDNYYHMVADSAAIIFNKQKEMQDRCDEEEKRRKSLEARVADLERQLGESKSCNRELEKALDAYKTVIDTYVYPEIANELLVREGALRKTRQIVNDENLNAGLITATVKINKTSNAETTSKSGSNVVAGLFRLED